MERMRLLSFLFICLPMMVSASTKAEIGGIWYELNSDGNATVISGESKGNYSGEVAIPEYVVYEGVEFSVTNIGEGAFSGCSDLNSLTIPSSINKIVVDAFSRCKNLESVYLLDLAAWCRIHFVKKTKAKDYGTNPLSYADHLYVNGKEVKDLVIPDGIKEISYCAFQGCKRSVKWLGVDREYFDDYELTYSNHVRDSHGNWISRTVHNSDPYSGDFKESRSILYYE